MQITAAWLCACDACRPSKYGFMRARIPCASCARSRSFHVARSRSPSRYVVRAAGETPPKLTLSASSATLLRHGCSCLRGASHSLQQLNAESVVALLDNEGTTVSFHTPLRRVPWSHLPLPTGRGRPCHGSLRLVLRLRPLRSADTGACAQSRSAKLIIIVTCISLDVVPRRQ